MTGVGAEMKRDERLKHQREALQNGKKMKMLKRHLMTDHGLTPAEYRARWGLPADYPMVAPRYAAARSMLAKKIGLGQRRKKS